MNDPLLVADAFDAGEHHSHYTLVFVLITNFVCLQPEVWIAPAPPERFRRPEDGSALLACGLFIYAFPLIFLITSFLMSEMSFALRNYYRMC